MLARSALALLLVSMMLPAASATTAAEAKTYPFPLSAPDPPGDQTAPGGAPGATCPECDLLNFEVTDDASNLVMRFTTASMSWTVPGGITLTVQATGPGGEDWEATVAIDSSGKPSAPADYDPQSTAGDPDVLMPGVTPEVDKAANQLYLFIDNGATGLAIGRSITIDSVSEGRGVATPPASGSPACASGCGASFSADTDAAAAGITYTLSNAATPTAPGTEAIALVTSKGNQTAPAGTPVQFPLTVSNIGTVATNFTMSSAGLPSGYNATFSSPQGTLAPNQTANVVLTVKAPAGAAAGRHEFTVTATAAKGTTKTITLAYTVGASTSTGTTTTTGGGGGGPGLGGTGTTTGPDGGTGGTGTDTGTTKASPGMDALSLAVAGLAAVLVARRRLE